MLSTELIKRTDEQLLNRKNHLCFIWDELQNTLNSACASEQTILKYYYATMPLQDADFATPQMLLQEAKHAVYLLENVEWCKNLPEAIFFAIRCILPCWLRRYLCSQATVF